LHVTQIKIGKRRRKEGEYGFLVHGYNNNNEEKYYIHSVGAN